MSTHKKSRFTGRRPAIVALLVIFFAPLVVVARFVIQTDVDVPRFDRPTLTVFLDQNWTDDQRQTYYHNPQGSDLIPYDWFLSLEQPTLSVGGAPLFRDDAYMAAFGFIPDAKSSRNPDALPVGLAKDEHFTDPYTSETRVVLGITCAGCHTGELFYRDKAFRIDAGPANIDYQMFTEALGAAVFWTYNDPLRFRRFANKVLGKGSSSDERRTLRDALRVYHDTTFANVKAIKHLLAVPEGYGRQDSISRIDNSLSEISMSDDWTRAKTGSSVRYPSIWNSLWTTPPGFTGKLGKDGLEAALGAGAQIDSFGRPAVAFQNVLDLKGLYTIEELIAGPGYGFGVRSPRWPESDFGQIDEQKSREGEKLYLMLCVACHGPSTQQTSFAPEWWDERKETYGKRLRIKRIVRTDYIGTDQTAAQDSDSKGQSTGWPDTSYDNPTTLILKSIVEQNVNKPDTDAPAMQAQSIFQVDAFAKSNIRSSPGYVAGSLEGIWATAPYLHNGSIPSVYELLSPMSERSKIFYLGSKQYDPVHMGLDLKQGAPAYERFDTRLRGNSNAGHEFTDAPRGRGVIGPALSPSERFAIIEYLKTL